MCYNQQRNPIIEVEDKKESGTGAVEAFLYPGRTGVKDSGAGGAGWIFTYRRWYGLRMGVQARMRVNGLGGSESISVWSESP